MDSIKDLLNSKADQIDTDGTRDDVHFVQTEIARLFKGVEVQRIQDDGSVLLTTRSAAVASDLRLRQHQIVTDLNSGLKKKLTKLRIRIQ